jgi:hypothetical protein
MGSNTVEVEDVTSTTGATMKTFLTKNTFVLGLNFPRLRLASQGLRDGYSGADFAEVGREIGVNKIEVYVSDISHPASYASAEDGDFFVLSQSLHSAFNVDRHVIVHEACHAIQDWSQWRCSRLDREVDAHFGQALFLVRSGDEKTASMIPPRLVPFLSAARQYNADAGYLKSFAFRKVLNKLEHEIFMDYQYTAQAKDPYFDPDQFAKDFNKRRREDGKTY